MRMHEPEFDPTAALFILWRYSPEGSRVSIAAGALTAMNAAWVAVQDEYPRDQLSLQHGARIVRRREPRTL